MEKKLTKLKRFMGKHAFSLILCVCVAIFAVTGLIAAKKVMSPMPKMEERDITANTPKDDVVIETPQPEPLGTELPQESKGPEPTEAPQEKELVLKSPLDGEIMNPFSDGKLVYSKTLEDFRVHNGIDIKSELSAPVKAAGDGVIADIQEDSMYGITIIIDHQNGIKTKYCNLSSSEMVKLGQEIKLGDVISGVGDTASFEMAEAPHLHFEVLKDDKCVNPGEYIQF